MKITAVEVRLVDAGFRSQWPIGTVAVSAISALEIAIWHIKGHQVGKPVYELFGGPTFAGRVPVDCHVPGGATPQEYADHIAGARARGDRVMKSTLPVYYGQKQKVCADGVHYGISGAADEAVHGDAVELWVDCRARLEHGRQGLVDVVEGPLPPEDIPGLLRLKEASYACGGPRIAGGERTATVYDSTMVSMLSSQAEALADELLTNPEVVRSREGYLDLPTGPGLGTRLNRDGLAARPFRRYDQTTRWMGRETR